MLCSVKCEPPNQANTAIYVVNVALAEASAKVDPNVTTQFVDLYSAWRQGLKHGDDGGEKFLGDDDGLFV